MSNLTEFRWIGSTDPGDKMGVMTIGVGKVQGVTMRLTFRDASEVKRLALECLRVGREHAIRDCAQAIDDIEP